MHTYRPRDRGESRARTRAVGRPAAATRVSHAAASTGRAHCPCAGGCPRCAAASSGPSFDAGQPLEAGVRRRLEASYGAELSGVRVHTGPAAAEASARLRARAFTSGTHLVFGRDQYAPHTPRGFSRIAHEVAHVLQQRNGVGTRSGAAQAGTEREADTAAAAAVMGGQRAVSMRSAGQLQRQEAEEAPRYLTSQPEFQLQLDPEIEAMMLQNYVRWWLGLSITDGEPPAQSEPEEQPGVTPGGAPPAIPLPHELPPDFLAPYDPSELGVEPDIGSVLAPYNARGVPLAARDVDAATAIFQQNYRFISVLPDLRDAAPGFLRPLIPSDWRSAMAEALTAATLNAQLRHDYPTPLEAADLSFYRMTGVSTTYFPIPGFSF